MKRTTEFAAEGPRWAARRTGLIVVLGLALLGRGAALATEPSLEDRASDLRLRVPDEFSVAEVPPFVLASDLGDQALHQTQYLVRWAVGHLKRELFSKDPAEPIEIWLFNGKESYRKNVAGLFHQEPPSPRGFYRADRHAILVNAATGGGVLVHEIVLAYERTNFPRSPLWFQEGLACLFEAATEKAGHLAGVSDWRLPELQACIRRGKLLSLGALAAATPSTFFGDDEDPGYCHAQSQARYLFLYLQEKGRLASFCQAMATRGPEDPDGAKTLQRVLGGEDLAAFQRKWEAFVLALPPG